MRILLLTCFGCLTLITGQAQEAPSAQKVQRAHENMERRERRLEAGIALREARAARRAAADADQESQSPTAVDTKTTPQNKASKPEGAHLLMNLPTYNFGDVPRKGGDLIHDFVFTNDGTAPLVVIRVITSCSCLKANFPKRPVAPGESAAIRIIYEPYKSEPGSFNKVIQIYSNSVDGRDVVTVQGNSIEEEDVVKIKGAKK